jgi:microsomal epoxide hydrolase
LRAPARPGAGAPWTYGTDVAYPRGLLGHRQHGFDWRAKQAAPNPFPQFRVPLHGIDLHLLHAPGEGPAPMPLLLSHGRPARSSSSLI